MTLGASSAKPRLQKYMLGRWQKSKTLDKNIAWFIVLFYYGIMMLTCSQMLWLWKCPCEHFNHFQSVAVIGVTLRKETRLEYEYMVQGYNGNERTPIQCMNIYSKMLLPELEWNLLVVRLFGCSFDLSCGF